MKINNTFVDPIKLQEIKVATDAVVFAKQDDDVYVLLIKREYEPFREKWAIPGGFLHTDEEIVDGAIREVREETNIESDFDSVKEIGVFGKVGRDPRRRIISIAYLFELDHLADVSKANESLEVEWKKLDELDMEELAFDHKDILEKAKEVFYSG